MLHNPSDMGAFGAALSLRSARLQRYFSAMVDPHAPRTASGFLHVHGDGGLTAREFRELLAVVEEAYESVSRAEVFVSRELDAIRAAQRWGRRWGPPELWLPLAAYGGARGDTIAAMSPPSLPLVVARVVLRSPGFWEFAGALNPLEVLRRYLNDRHERAKDRDYRSRAEAERLAIGNAAASLDVLRQYLELQREYGDELGGIESLSEQVIGAVRPALERVGEVDDRGLIAGQSARSGPEPIKDVTEE